MTDSLPIETFRKKPVEVQTILWDGTPERAQQIKEWVGERDNGERRFLLPEDITGVWHEAHVWNDQEHGWIPCPVSHRVVRGPLGEFYPISPEAVEKTYEAVVLRTAAYLDTFGRQEVRRG